jgi:hypothetical protein
VCPNLCQLKAQHKCMEMHHERWTVSALNPFCMKSMKSHSKLKSNRNPEFGYHRDF